MRAGGQTEGKRPRPRRLRCTLKRLPSFLVLASLSTLAVATPSEAQPAVGLDNFGSCRDFVKFERQRALPIVARLEDQRRKWAEERKKKAEELGQALPVTGAPALPSPPAPLVKAPASPQKFSTTNVQEAGVDEPDMVKADGSHIFAIEDGRLQAIDAQAASPQVVGSLALPGADPGSEMLLFGNRVFVISRVYKREPPPKPIPGTGAADDGIAISAPRVLAFGATHTQIKEVDVDDPGAMRVVRTLEVKGRYVSARQVGDSARVVISSSVPLPDSRAALAQTRLEDWMPSYVLKGRRSGGVHHRPLVPCDEVEQPAKFSGRSMLSVLTLDLSGGMRLADSDSVMTDGDTVYASQNSLYVATERWFEPAESEDPERVITTSIHKFDISNPRQTEYTGSGSVRGYLLSQFSMSENGGFLRVASSDEDPDFTDRGDHTQSRVTVLEARGGRLDEVGKVAGIGRGESIYAVRFMGDVGYIVTFRTTDPLFTVDLATPDRPKVVGELKLRGYSAYLHPIDNGLLIGIGQDADESGRETGSQISLFDISDPSRPVRLDQRTIAPDSYSNVEWDHHAFLYWPQRALTVIPLEAYDDGRFSGAVGFRVTRAGGIEEAGRLTQQRGELAAEVDRTVVVGERLFAISYRGVRVSDLETLGGGDWVPFRRD